MVRFSRARKRYERQGILVEEAALEQAEQECLADADARQLARAGRVGRSASAKQLEASAVELAVRARVRHEHTSYDELLAPGRDRRESRAQVGPQPNHTRHEWAPWDAYVFVDDPDALATELGSRGVTFHREMVDRGDGLRGFEVCDCDGYVLFFGRPR